MQFLKDIFRKQIALQKKIGIDIVKVSKDYKDVERMSAKFTHCIFHELVELDAWTNWKFWKKTKVKYDNQRIKEIHLELIDILHFWVNLCIIWGLSPENIVDIFNEKNKENLDRQDRGY